MAARSPSFQFYPYDFLSDAHLAVMSAEEIGVYWLLMSYCWIEGELPNDFTVLARLGRVPPKWFTEARRELFLKCFSVKKNGKLFEKKLQKQKSNQADWRRKSKEGGIKSGETRRKRSKGGSTVVQRPLNSSTSTSSSTSSSEEERSTSSGIERERGDSLSLFSDEFFAELQSRKIYQHLNVKFVFEKYSIWCGAQNVEPNRAQFIGWLNSEKGDVRDDRGSEGQLERVAASFSQDN